MINWVNDCIIVFEENILFGLFGFGVGVSIWNCGWRCGVNFGMKIILYEFLLL